MKEVTPRLNMDPKARLQRTASGTNLQAQEVLALLQKASSKPPK